MAFGGGGPHFCLGANLARMEIRVMFDRLLDRLPDIHLDGEVQRLRSNFINGVKHIPVAFTPSAPHRSLTPATGPPSGDTYQKADVHHAFPPGSHLPARRRDPEPVRGLRQLGYSGIYFSDHLFNPRDLEVAVHLLEGTRRRSLLGEGDRVARPDVPDLGAVRR